MPVMGGIEFLEQFRLIVNKGKSPPLIVVISTSALDADIKRTRQLGISLYLNKLINQKKILQAVDLIESNTPVN